MKRREIRTLNAADLSKVSGGKMLEHVPAPLRVSFTAYLGMRALQILKRPYDLDA
jgi:hypothetical protein